MEKELQKATSLISSFKQSFDSKSNVNKELEQLMEDNELLRQKLALQEEDFRLENKTLMQKLTALMKTNENYEIEINNFKREIGSIDEKRLGTANLNYVDELNSLRAQNLSLQTTLENTIQGKKN